MPLHQSSLTLHILGEFSNKTWQQRVTTSKISLNSENSFQIQKFLNVKCNLKSEETSHFNCKAESWETVTLFLQDKHQQTENQRVSFGLRRERMEAVEQISTLNSEMIQTEPEKTKTKIHSPGAEDARNKNHKTQER